MSGKSPFRSVDFVIIFIVVMVALVGLGVVGPLMPVYAESMGATGFWIGMIYSSFSVARAVFNQPVGMLSDRRGRKLFLMGGLALYATVSIFYIFARNIEELIIVRFFNGMGSALVIPVGMAYVGDLAPKGREGEYMGTFNIAIFTGFGIGPFLGGVVSDMYGYESVFYILGAMSFSALILTGFLRARPRTEKRKDLAPMRTVVKDSTVQALFLWRSVNALGRGFMISFLAIYGVLRLDLSLSQVGVILTIYLLLMAVLQGPFGRLADRISRVKMVIWGSTISMAALVLIPFTTGFWDLLLINIVNGLGNSMAMPAATAINTNVGRKLGMGNLMGLFNTAMSVGMIFGPLTAGVVYDVLDIDWVFWSGGMIMLFGTFIFYGMMRRVPPVEAG